MASERSIPHLRDIFGIKSYNSHVPTNDRHASSLDPYSNPHMSHDYKKHHHSRKSKHDNQKPMTNSDVKVLERHLSMKKTIRKKIMRDLQQAFVDDPNEFQVENTNAEHMKAELKAETLRFGENPSKKSDNFLVMLRGGDQHQGRSVCTFNNALQREYDYDSPALATRDEKQSFWKRFTMKTKSKR